MERNKLYIIIPAYNEEENIGRVVEEWHRIAAQLNMEGCEASLVVIDDGSKDNTYQILKELLPKYPFLIAKTKANQGHGATILYGYKFAIEEGADYIFQTDSDGQTSAEEFGPFWDRRSEFDMVIGNRSKRGDGLSRVVVTKMLKLVIYLCFGVGVTDANTPFRLMNAHVLKRYIGMIPDNYNLTNVIISVIYKKMGLRIEYIPISFKERQGGVNSINIKSIGRIGIKALKDFRDIDRTIKGGG